MTARRTLIVAAAVAVVVIALVLLAGAHVGGDFVVVNRTNAVLTEIELIHYDKTYRRIDRLEPDQTVRMPHDGSEEGWAVAYTDSDGRWIAPGCIYPEGLRDEDVAIRPGHVVNNDQAHPMK